MAQPTRVRGRQVSDSTDRGPKKTWIECEELVMVKIVVRKGVLARGGVGCAFRGSAKKNRARANIAVTESWPPTHFCRKCASANLHAIACAMTCRRHGIYIFLEKNIYISRAKYFIFLKKIKKIKKNNKINILFLHINVCKYSYKKGGKKGGFLGHPQNGLLGPPPGPPPPGGRVAKKNYLKHFTACFGPCFSGPLLGPPGRP